MNGASGLLFIDERGHHSGKMVITSGKNSTAILDPNG